MPIYQQPTIWAAFKKRLAVLFHLAIPRTPDESEDPPTEVEDLPHIRAREGTMQLWNEVSKTWGDIGGGGAALPAVIEVNTSTTLDEPEGAYDIIEVSDGGITITLPPSMTDGKGFIIKRIDNNPGDVIINGLSVKLEGIGDAVSIYYYLGQFWVYSQWPVGDVRADIRDLVFSELVDGEYEYILAVDRLVDLIYVKNTGITNQTIKVGTFAGGDDIWNTGVMFPGQIYTLSYNIIADPADVSVWVTCEDDCKVIFYKRKTVI